MSVPSTDDYSFGVIYFHHRIEDVDNAATLPAPFKIAYYMPGHTYEDEDLLPPNALIETWRTGCKSADGPGHGTFIVESSAISDPDAFAK